MNLEDFYYQIVCATAPCDRYYAVQELQDVIVVNFDCIYDREVAIRGIDQLLFLLHQKGTNKRFLFISEDGALIEPSGAKFIIENIIRTFDLNKDSCCLIAREYIEINNCDIIIKESIDYWCRALYPYIKNIPIYTAPFERKFAAWFHRGTIFRAEIAQHLLSYHKENSYVSYQEQGIVLDRNLKQYFDQQCLWANNNTPVVYDQLFPNRIYDFNMIVGEQRKPYSRYFLEIVVETDVVTNNWITEKTVKNLYIGKPFLVMAGEGTLRRLRNRGFKTFSPWIDESYDSIFNISDRLNAIKLEIDRLARLDLNQMYLEMLPVLEYNRKIYANLTSRG